MKKQSLLILGLVFLFAGQMAHAQWDIYTGGGYFGGGYFPQATPNYYGYIAPQMQMQYQFMNPQMYYGSPYGYQVPYGGEFDYWSWSYPRRNLSNPSITVGGHTRYLGFRERSSGSSLGSRRLERRTSPATEVSRPAPAPATTQSPKDKCEPKIYGIPKGSNAKCTDIMSGTEVDEVSTRSRIIDEIVEENICRFIIEPEKKSGECKYPCELSEDGKEIICGDPILKCKNGQIEKNGKCVCPDGTVLVVPQGPRAPFCDPVNTTPPPPLVTPTPGPVRPPIRVPVPPPPSGGTESGVTRGCPPGTGYDGNPPKNSTEETKDRNACFPCPKGAFTNEKNECVCPNGHDVINDEFVCTNLEDKKTEGDTCIDCNDKNISRLCEAIGSKEICDKTCDPSKKPKYPEILSKPEWSNLSANEKTNARCIAGYMKKAGDIRNFVECPGGKQGKDKGYCLDNEYLQQVYLGFDEATKCFFNTEKDKLYFLSMLGHESRFQLNALNTTDPSLSIGQTLHDNNSPVIDFSRYIETEPKKWIPTNKLNDNSVSRLLSNSAFSGCKGEECKKCEADFAKYFNDIRPHLGTDNFCASDITKNPKQAIFLAAAAYGNKKRHVNRYLTEGFNCVRGGKTEKIKLNGFSSNGSVVNDLDLLNRLSMVAYNQGEGTLQALLCAYELGHQIQPKVSPSAKVNRVFKSSKFEFNVRDIVSADRNLGPGHFSLPANEKNNIKHGKRIQTKGFWKLQDEYYSRGGDRTNYFFKTIEDARKVQDNGGPTCSPDLQ